MKLFSRKSAYSHGAFSLGRGAAAYIPLLLFAVIFTEALHSTVSIVFLWFVATLPIVSFFYALIGRANVGAFVLSDETTVEKLTSVGYEFRVSNYSVLPLPFTEAELFLPTSDGIFCESRLVKMSILPRGEYHFKSDVTFQYRGNYRVGVGCVYVSDFLRIFRLRRSVNIYSKIYVMPRRMIFSRDDDRSPSDTPTDGRVTDGNESGETNLIREYRGGDPLKHIHWKLSSKMQDLQVNDYKPNSGRNIFIFCDFATLFSDGHGDRGIKRRVLNLRRKAGTKKTRVVKVKLPERPADQQMSADDKLAAMADAAADKAAAAAAVARNRRALADENEKGAAEPRVNTHFARANDVLAEKLADFDEYCADGISEIAIGIVMNELGRGNFVTLMWFDERADSGYFCYSVHSHDDVDAFFRHFGTAPVCPHDMKVTLLPSLLDDIDSPTFIYVTSSAGIAELNDYLSASRGAGAERTEIMLFDPEDRFENRELHEEYVDLCRYRYAENKIKLTAVDPSWGTEN